MAEERTGRLVVLGAILALITAIVIWQTGGLLVEAWVLGAVAVPFAGLSVLLRVKQDSIGFEGKYVDWWSIPHFVVGVLFGLVGMRLGYVVLIASVWELVEVFAHTREAATNRAIDIVLAAAGWATANLMADGGFLLL
jgi:hypothetical protein